MLKIAAEPSVPPRVSLGSFHVDGFLIPLYSWPSFPLCLSGVRWRESDEGIVKVVFEAKNIVCCAGDPTVSLASACEGFVGLGGAGPSEKGGDVVDADGEEGPEAGREWREREEAV